jgi:basic amino acid/polyamine antiporter, APA family
MTGTPDDRPSAPPATASGLRRTLGLADAVGIGVGAIVGAGIFVVTGIAAEAAGPALLLALVLAGIAATANALSSAQLAAAYPQSGGTYEYGYRTWHPWAGYTAGWMFLSSKTAAAGTVAIGMGAYLDLLVPGVPGRALSVGAVVVFTALNWFGIRRTSTVNLLIVGVSVSVLLAFTAAGFMAMDVANFRPFAPAGVPGVMEGAALIFFAYTGYARIATLGEEVREPARTIPRAIIITVAFATTLYLLVAAAAIGAAGVAGLSGTGAPLAEAMRVAGRPALVPVVALGAMAAMLGVLLSQLLGLSRMAFAMARRGDLPRGLAHVSDRTGAPSYAVLAVGAAAVAVAALGELRPITAAAAFAILVYYGIANISALRMPADKKLFPDVVPMVGLLACGALAFSLDARTLIAGAVLLAAGAAVRLVVRALGGGESGDAAGGAPSR